MNADWVINKWHYPHSLHVSGLFRLQQVFPEKLLDRVGVPFLNTELFLNVSVGGDQLDDGLSSSHVLDGQVGK